MKKSAMIISVGTGVGTGKFKEQSRKKQITGIKNIIKEENIDKIYFLVTTQSIETAKAILNDLKIDYDFINLEDRADDFLFIREKLIKEIKKIKKSFDYVVSVPLGGTKIMTTMLFYISLLENVKITIITARRENDNLALAGSENPMRFNPYEINDKERLEIIEYMFNNGYFKSANEIANRIISDKIKLNDNEISKYELIQLTEFFFFVDSFNFDGIRKLDPLKINKNIYNIMKYYKDLFNAISNMKKINDKEIKIKYINQMIFEMYKNAVREIKKGKYDNAMARFYRIMEFILQIKLYQFDIITTDFLGEYSNFTDLKSIFGDYMSDEEIKKFLDKDDDEKTKIALKKSYELLKKIEELKNIKILSIDENKFKKLLSLRNNSILAHGINHIDEKTAIEMKEMIENMMQTTKIIENVEKKDIPKIKLDL